MDELLNIIEQNELITYAERYKSPKKMSKRPLDETTYNFIIAFSDDSLIATDEQVGGLEEFFYRLAEQNN